MIPIKKIISRIKNNPLSIQNWFAKSYSFIIPMKRKESLDKSKPNKDLANQLKARLFDKGTLLLSQASATAPCPPSSDRSKTITIRSQPKVTPLWSPWARINPIIESLKNNRLSSRSQQPNNTPKKNFKKFKCPSFEIRTRMKKIESAT